MIWTTMDRTRHFILPDDAELAPGGLALRTSTGRERTVDEAAVLPYEVTEEEARAWARAQLGEVFGDIREQTLGFVEKLRQKTAVMREENRRTWEQAVADAPPEVREAGAHLRDLLKDLGATLRQAAREHGAGSAPPADPIASPAPPADGASTPAPSGSTSTETPPPAPDGSAPVAVDGSTPVAADGSTPVVVDGSTTAMADEATSVVLDGSSSAAVDGSTPSVSGDPSAPPAARTDEP